ncbi:Bromodomain associated-domain-containing protein [Zychaea mexicana]|uniref:Bromodomain associated-domain-containing protein n=1 Tax=Zychaea mexicana TaxID=64656 RepID=UPI0022FDB68C|nr:Bromodomain associated-domain-containing protein [Zychaea mexicana]KAI9489900.1 Bromodomain associated-domain-containing protein [Zychaea mexicana]
MTDQFCFALLRTTALQILQSAGFDSAHSDPTNSLTDILSQYIQLLASTTSSYAQLAGRSTGNIRDVVDGLDELGITPESLKEWLELEGKALMPSWTPQSDPGRTLEDVVRNGRSNHDDALVYEYKDIPSDSNDDDDENEYDEELYFLDGEVEKEEGAKDEAKELIPKGEKKDKGPEENNGLPDYIPPYLPRFPSSVKEDATPPPRALPQVMPSITRQSSPGSPAVPAPIIVRHRKKPVENPFTHVVPFEESALAADKGATLLSLRENEENSRQQHDQQELQQSPASKRRRVALSSLPMKKAMYSLADKEQQERRKQQREALAGNHAMFRKFTQDEAAPGNTMFGNSAGILEELLRRVAPPAMISKLSSPNLLVDVAMTSAPAPAANPTSNGTTPAQQESTAIRPSSSSAHGNNNNNNNNSGAGASNINNTSMLATLAGGQYNRKHPSEEIITASTSRPTTSTPTLPSSSSASSLAATAAVALPTSATTTTTPAAAVSKPTSTTSPTQRPISLASLSSGGGADGGKPTGKSKSGEKKSSERNSGERKSGERKTTEKGSEKKKVPKLTLNLSNGNNGGAGAGGSGGLDGTAPSTAENTPSSASSVNTPKIRFKIKRPEPANEKIDITSTDDLPPPPSSTPPAPPAPAPAPAPIPPVVHTNGEEVQDEVVRCICDHPTIDYGTFMISCDKCHVWYHGECVGIAESDKVETWYCRNCK